MNIFFDKESSVVAFNTGDFSSYQFVDDFSVIFFYFQRGKPAAGTNDFVIKKFTGAISLNDPRVLARDVTDKEGVALARKRIKKLTTNDLLQLDIAKVEFCIEKLLAYKDMTMKVQI